MQNKSKEKENCMNCGFVNYCTHGGVLLCCKGERPEVIKEIKKCKDYKKL